ncbi:MAG: transcription termination/antitermination protein NusG [Gammaproteobacteria bacterium GWE2_42_36]|nr:MAG: transcription termination/antitermination protein NusG [Gammaproteobacteria bacterium GWE2_42_36]HCU05834.1 transcription termination/antitermination protein NusG [Coxiellaceae bacterium]
MQWYAIHVFSGAETYVMNALRQRAAQKQMEGCFGEIMVPKEKVVEMRRGQKCTSERKYFPGYVLVNMVMNDDTWHLVKSVPKVLGFIGGKSDKPAPLSENDVNEIFNRMQAGEDKPKPKIVYEVGEVVRVINGPFADFNGVVEEVNYEKNRLRVAVLIFGRSTPVELEFNQVEKG